MNYFYCYIGLKFQVSDKMNIDQEQAKKYKISLEECIMYICKHQLKLKRIINLPYLTNLIINISMYFLLK